MFGRQSVMAGIEKIAQHSEKVKIDKAGALIEQKRPKHEHLFERQELFGQGSQQLFVLALPLIDATSSELALFVAEKAQSIGGGHHFLPKDIIELKTGALDLIFDVAPEDGLDAFV